MRVPDATSLPPRSALPRDIQIPALPELGRTWYDRGGKYWARRTALAFMWAVVLLLIVMIDAGIFGAIRQSSAAGFVVLLAIDAAVAVAVLADAAVRTARYWNTPALPGQAGAALHPGAVVGWLAQIGYVLAVLAAAVVFLFCPGGGGAGGGRCLVAEAGSALGGRADSGARPRDTSRAASGYGAERAALRVRLGFRAAQPPPGRRRWPGRRAGRGGRLLREAAPGARHLRPAGATRPVPTRPGSASRGRRLRR
jgi:hypothetical protein